MLIHDVPASKQMSLSVTEQPASERLWSRGATASADMHSAVRGRPARSSCPKLGKLDRRSAVGGPMLVPAVT